jgi:M6 family metalloprotease-like protein
MKNKTKAFAAALAAVSLCLSGSPAADAVPAYPWPVTVTQPDGTSFQVRIVGDEFAHYMVDMEGHALTRGEDGRYCYALYGTDGSLQNSGYEAGTNEVPQTVLNGSLYIPYEAMSLKAAEGRRSSAWRTSSGSAAISTQSSSDSRSGTNSKKSLKVLIILAQYADVPYTHTQADFENMFNQEGYNTYGSVSDYFTDMAGEYYDFEFTVSPIVTLSRNRAYYGGNDSNGSDQNAPEAVVEACKLADNAGIDFSDFDGDNDGVVDAVSIIMAGNGEEAGAGDDCIWSHQWELDYAGKSLTLDGKKINGYNICCECRGVGKTMTDIGVFCHEFSHNLGLMDIYDTDYSESGGNYSPAWMMTSVRAQGCYCYDGDCPIGYSAMDYYCLGLGTSTTVTSGGSKTLGPVDGSGHPYMIFNADVSGEVFLIEYRTAEGWNRYLSNMNYGVGVYHIDQSSNSAGLGYTAKERWDADAVNAYPNHPCADMITRSSGNTNTPFFPAGNINRLDSSVNSKYKTWSGNDPDYRLSNITLSSESASFNILTGAAEKPRTPNITTVDVFQDAAIISWECSDATYEGTSYVVTDNGDYSVSAYETGKYAILLDGLNPSTAYSYTIYFKDSEGNDEDKITDKFTTKSETSGAMPYIILPTATRYSDGTFAKGSAFPLRVANETDAKTISWTFDGSSISADGSCYWKPSAGGTLKATVTLDDGTVMKIIRKITLK